jgi:hypothetical protein
MPTSESLRQHRKSTLGIDPVGVVASGDEQLPGTDDADAFRPQGYRIECAQEVVDLVVVLVDFGVQRIDTSSEMTQACADHTGQGVLATCGLLAASAAGRAFGPIRWKWA